MPPCLIDKVLHGVKVNDVVMEMIGATMSVIPKNIYLINFNFSPMDQT